jgi:phage tail sheath protein FI
VVVTGAGDATDATQVLLLGVARDGAERTGDEVLHDLLSGTVGTSGSHVVTMSGGTDGEAPLPGDYADVFAKFLKIRDINTICLPGCTYGPASATKPVIDQAIAHAEQTMSRLVLVDPPADTALLTEQDVDALGLPTSSYAALYYPWLAIPDPYPANLADVRDYAIPPSGHMLGVYARTDIERGVHKAPANEVVRGITGLRRRVNKEQQDILNPYPSNINVIRDFRDNNRGIRVYGARVITSDPDWKYVNVRRLLIFIEASIDRGLQWVVFEPNSEPLWARVQRTVANFLTVVWRDGALEGTKPEEAFFVRCDRTTMTQTDIDNGRLIVQVGVAPVKPAEFVIVRIGLWTARSDS